MAKFVSGRSIVRNGTIDTKELSARLDALDGKVGSFLDDLRGVAAQAASATSSSSSGASLDSPSAPTLVDETTYPPGPSYTKHWLRANYPKSDPSGSTVVPFVKIRAVLPSGITLESSVYTLVLGVWNSTQDVGISVTRNLSSHDVADGYCDLVVPTSDMALGDSCYALLVALAANGGYAENVYDASARPFLAGTGLGPPETPTIAVIHTRPHHTDFQLTVVNTYDSVEPYTGPDCCNFYDKLEVWKSEAASIGQTPDSPGTSGWWEADFKPLQGIVRRIKTNPSDNKKSFTVNHKASTNLRMAFRIHQTDGQVGPWVTYTVGQPGIDDPDYAPGYMIVSGNYAPGGASNPWSNAASDPGTGCWNAEEDLPGTPGKEVSVRARIYFTATDGGTVPAANANNLHGSLHLKEYNASTGVYRHFTPEFSVVTPATDTYVDVEFKHKFKKGRTLTFVKGVLKNHGETHTATFSQTVVAGGGSITAAPLAPTLGAPTHTKMATVWPCTLNSDATHFLVDLRKVEIYLAPTGTTGTPDTNSAWKKRKTMDVEDDVAAGRTSVELSVNRTSSTQKAAIARCKDAYGQWGAWSAISDTGTVPGTDDTPPSVPTITSTSSYLKDLKGTPRKECDLTVNFTAPGCTDVEVSVVDPDGAEKKRIRVTGSGTETVYWKHKFDYGDALAITIKGINGTAESAWSAATNTTAGASTAALPSQTALAPVISSCTHTRMGSVYVITLPNSAGTVYDCIRKIQFWWAPTGTTAPTGQATPSATWKKIKTVDVDELAGGTNTTMEIEVHRPNGTRKGAVCRIVDAAGRRSDWSNGYDTGTPPGTDDTPPATPTIGTVTSALKDVKGTRRKECDLTIPLTFSGCDKVEVEVSDPDGVVSRSKVVTGLTAATVYWKHKFDQGDTLRYRVRGKNGTAYSDWSTLDASWPGSAPSIVAGGAKGSTPAFTGLTVRQAKQHHTVFEAAWSGAAAGGYVAVEVEIYENSTWVPLKTKDIVKLASSGKCSIRVLHEAAYEKPCIRLNLRDRWDQESGYYPSSSGTDATWWASGGSDPGDGSKPISAYPWLQGAGFAYNAAGYISLSTGASVDPSPSYLNIPLHKQRVKAHGNWTFINNFNGQTFGFLVPNGSYGKSGYYFKITSSTTGQLYGVNASGGASAIGAAVTFPALTLGTDVEFKFEIHRTKIVLILGPQSTRFEWSDTTYRTVGWMFCISLTAANTETRLYSLAVNNDGQFYDGLAAANTQANLDANGFLNADNVKATIGGTSVALSTLMHKVGSNVYFNGAYVRGTLRCFASLASLPTSDVKAGDLVCYYESAGSGAGKYRIGLYLPTGCLDGTNPTSDLIVNFNGDATNAGAAGSSATGGSGGTGGTCFLGSTLVRTPFGPRRYDALRPGDLVTGCDQLTGEDVDDTVVDVKEHEADWHLDLGLFGVTEEHVLFAWTGGAKPASCVQHTAGAFPLGGLLYGQDGPVALATKAVVKAPAKVYSITTRTKAYWVGDGEVFVLAHNAKSLDI